MTVKVFFLHSAEADLKEIRSYLLKHFGRETWQASYSKIKDSVAVIQSFPDGGNVPDELASLNLAHYRQVISGMNRIIYEVRGDTAYVHIVCDARKDLRSVLTKRLLRAV